MWRVWITKYISLRATLLVIDYIIIQTYLPIARMNEIDHGQSDTRFSYIKLSIFSTMLHTKIINDAFTIFFIFTSIGSKQIVGSADI